MENKKLKVAVFTDSFYPGTGGTERAVDGIASGLVENGCEVMVCAPKYGKRDYKSEIYQINRAKSIKLSDNSYLPIMTISANFKKVLRAFKPDIIHCNTLSPFVGWAIRFSKNNNIPCVVTVHTKFSFYFSPKGKDSLLSKFKYKYICSQIKKCDRVCAVSNSMKAEFAKYGYFGDFDVVKNGSTFTSEEISADVKKLAQAKYGISDEDNVLIFVGHVEKIKNIDFIFESLKIVDQKFENFKMMFVGSIDDKDFYDNVKNSSLKDKVVFTNNITSKEMLSSIYANAKLFLFPSVFDNDPLTIVESATHKVPSVVLENTGASERINNNETGFVIQDAQSMAEKIVYLLNNKSIIEQVGENASKQLPIKWKDASKRYLSIYYETIRNFKK